MGQVYSTAQQVVIYLEDAEDKSTLALDLANKIHKFFDMDGYFLALSRTLETGALRAASFRAGLDVRGWTSLLHLISRRWFLR